MAVLSSEYTFLSFKLLNCLGPVDMPNVKEALTDEEIEIHLYLASGDTPSDATLKKFTKRFWMKEPFK